MYIKNNVVRPKLSTAIVLLGLYGLLGCTNRVEETSVEMSAIELHVQEDATMSAAPADDGTPAIMTGDLVIPDSQTDLRDDLVNTEPVKN